MVRVPQDVVRHVDKQSGGARGRRLRAHRAQRPLGRQDAELMLEAMTWLQAPSRST